MSSDRDVLPECCSPSDLSKPQLLSPSPSVGPPDSPMGYAILQYHTGSIPGQGMLCQDALTDHYQLHNPSMDGCAPYQPISEATSWSFSCLSPTQFAIQNGNISSVVFQPELARDVKPVSILSPMTVTDFELNDQAAHQALPSPSTPPDDTKPNLVQEVPASNEPPTPPDAPAAPPSPKARRGRGRPRRTLMSRPIAISGSSSATTATATTPSPTSAPPQPSSPDADADADAAATTTTTTTVRKAGHSAVERKYREGMNGAMNRLRAIIPFAQRSDAGDKYVGPRRLPSKAAVLHRAAEEIADLRAARARADRKVRALQEDRDRWRRRAEALWRVEGRGAEDDEVV